jgi:hypothetical protein
MISIKHCIKTTAKGIAAIAIAASLSGLAVPRTLAASTQPQLVAQSNALLGDVRDRLIIGGAFWIQRGYELTHEPSMDALGDGQSQWITLNLQGGVNYSMIAAGDRNCRDLDLSVYDENGNLIDSDIEVDDIPVLQISPRWTGTFRVKVTMANTNTSYSYYGVSIFGR